jgi:hypothetical protein
MQNVPIMNVLQSQGHLDEPVQNSLLWQAISFALRQSALQVTCSQISVCWISQTKIYTWAACGLKWKDKAELGSGAGQVQPTS